MSLKFQNTSTRRQTWTIGAVILLLGIKAFLQYNGPKPTMRHNPCASYSPEEVRTTRIHHARDGHFSWDKRIEQMEEADGSATGDDDTVFLRFQSGAHEGSIGYYALKKGNQYVRKHSEDDTFTEIMFDGDSLEIGADELPIDEGFVSPDLNYILFLTQQGDKDCGVYWLWDVRSQSTRFLTSERLCKPAWAHHSTAIVFSSTEISNDDVYFYYTEQDQLVHHHHILTGDTAMRS